MTADRHVAGRYFTRIQAGYVGRLGVEVGVFVAVDHLRRADLLTADEEKLYLDVDDWFRERLPAPPFYADGNSIAAVTWFKPGLPGPMGERIEALRRILLAHGVAVETVTSSDPGEIVYEDDWQIGVVPRERRPPTPLPGAASLRATSAESKRGPDAAGQAS